MLKSLYIRNYALIEELEIRFSTSLTIITGETGAGKSILLGALGLIVGNRADASVLQDKASKCIVEAEFDISAMKLKPFFDAHELEYDASCIIRREILPGGKSRAFVNDSPVQLTVLKSLGNALLDIHSQQETWLLRDAAFQIEVLDLYAGTAALVQQYRKDLLAYRSLRKDIARVSEENERSKTEADFWQFQFDELEKATLSENEQAALEDELKRITHSDEIRTAVDLSIGALEDSEESILKKIHTVRAALGKISSYSDEVQSLAERLQSAEVELRDIAASLEDIASGFEADPGRQLALEERLGMIYTLQKKHRVNTVAGLIEVRLSLEEKLRYMASADDTLQEMQARVEALHAELQKNAAALHKERVSVVPALEADAIRLLKLLGMPDAVVGISVEQTDGFNELGADEVIFGFSANKGMPPQALARIGSGGEVSRFMLAVKALLSGKKELPTILFDEIDTGVSGNVADKVGKVMQKMAANMQVIAITHLPQIASKGEIHLKVRKKTVDDKTVTGIVQLSEKERIEELAKMLSGAHVTKEALENARVLLGIPS